ncbi:hypothetical protein K474DRAFT_1371215 [Panus rudis PR-1116 ss-1]|nr:hypothetical protein K474DRAFT_1371215 [Panus rudis PR-1116 ss-1]
MDTTVLHSALGPLLLGGLVSTGLYGITCTQTFVYYQRNSSDRLAWKLVVFTLWILDTLDVALNGHILYYYLVANFANPLALASPVWSLLIHVTVTGVSNFLVRGMFTRKVWRLSHGNWLLTGFICAVSLLDLVCSIVITVKAFHATFAGIQTFSTLLYLDFAAVFTADTTVALSLCYYLHVSRTGIKSTDSLINVLMLYTVNTGLLTAIDATAGLVMFAAIPNSLIYVAFYLQLSKLYVNAYLATLNARDTLRERTEEFVSIHLSHLSRQPGSLADPPSSLAPSQISSPVTDKHKDALAISVSTNVDTSYDSADFKRPYGN